MRVVARPAFGIEGEPRVTFAFAPLREAGA
jgi:hypothetical protein